MMYSFDEVGLIPTTISDISSRKFVNPYKDNKLPIFVAPMTCILNDSNFDIFKNSKVIPIMPKWYNHQNQLLDTEDWQALTLAEFNLFFNTSKAQTDINYHILIDVANGHMQDLYTCVKEAKEKYANLTIMIGNIANPKTYIECCKAGIDYVRVGIGGGSGCTTSVQTGMHASLPYLLEKITLIKKALKDNASKEFRFLKVPKIKCFTKVIADGGVNSIDKAIKALALGADYVMMGKCFAQCEEACGDITVFEYSNGTTKTERKYYGQSSEQGQLDRFGKIKSNPEGNSSIVEISGTLSDFENKFEAALRSSMSYAGAHTLEEFHPDWEIMSINEFNCYKK